MYKILVSHEVEVCRLQVIAKVRYWEDATINGVEDTEGKLTPCRFGETWKPCIDLETGKIVNWIPGITADIHFKVCDEGEYILFDKDNHEVRRIDGHVPKIMSPEENGYGDYIIMKVDEDGFIQNWRVVLDEFTV